MSKPTKSERREDRINNLERENASLKKKNAELQQQKTVQLNDEQLQKFLDDLTQRIEWSTNRIVDEMPRSISVRLQENKENDGVSYFIKLLIAIPFFAVAIVIVYSFYGLWSDFWEAVWASRVALFTIAIIVFDCAALGIEVLREKDRNYIVSVFSALVALVALIVALVK